MAMRVARLGATESRLMEALRGQVKSGQRGSGQNRPTDVARDMVLLSHLLLIRQVCFRSPTPWSALQDVTVVQQTVEHGGDGRAVTEQFAQSSTGRLEVS